ncbi:hypothetical protein PPSIR1_29138 [Plesiocystis pacifica SIR-1]|uniref:Uncharacterized protein n=1 Tax=Plesiocystis pacifica SIR-1 TaxID=391625 RepID=A6GHV9_9BACT|nr:hypothetical protein PPSIR1_29138 [Plesiocystis pacifica SIR-1]
MVEARSAPAAEGEERAMKPTTQHLLSTLALSAVFALGLFALDFAGADSKADEAASAER